MSTKRIVGIDVARAIAVIGMIIVNFKVVFGDQGPDALKLVAGVFDGKAAATFVVLAGVGIALMTQSAVDHQDTEKLRSARKRIGKRAMALFVIGLSYMPIWPADILHFYGVYMLIVLLLIRSRSTVLMTVCVGMVVVYPFLLGIWDYERGWAFATLTYQDFWTVSGFTRNLWLNGFHPVIPWTAFMVFGLWLGRKDLRDQAVVGGIMKVSALVFVVVQLLSLVLSLVTPADSGWALLWSTDPMPPLLLYMINGMAIAATIISASILLGYRYASSVVLDALTRTGQLALTFYVAHVVLGMGAIYLLAGEAEGQATLFFSLGYALVFSGLCVLFAVFWTRRFKQGPLEFLLRKVTG